VIKVDGNCISNYILTRIWTATDESGNTISHTKITVNDTTAPTTTTVTPSINVNCDAIPAKPDLYLWIIALLFLLYFTENIINRTDNSYSIIRKWLVSDTCGNTSVLLKL
jgi:hypothetical protein